MKQPAPQKIFTTLSTPHGEFDFGGYFWNDCDDSNILALVRRPIMTPCLVRVQSVCYSGEIFESSDCDCHDQLTRSLELISKLGGVFIYMLRDGRGAGLKAKLSALAMWKDRKLDTVEAYDQMGIGRDPRQYEKAAHVVSDLGIESIRLLKNNPRKIAGMEHAGLRVTREPLEIQVPTQSDAAEYLRVKAQKLGHWLKQFDP
jgi:GTP cyclohydrolase II